MALSMWAQFFGSVSAGRRDSFRALLGKADIDVTAPTGSVEGFGAAVFERAEGDRTRVAAHLLDNSANMRCLQN